MNRLETEKSDFLDLNTFLRSKKNDEGKSLTFLGLF